MATGSLNPTNGLFRPIPPSSGDINPFRDGSAFNTCILASGNLSVKIPGVIFDVKGNDRIEYWWVLKSPNMGYAVTVWRGTLLCESIKISVHLVGEQEYDEWSHVRLALQPNAQDSAWYISFPCVNFGGVSLVGVRMVGTPKSVGRGIWDAVLDLIEYRKPQPIHAGPPDPPKKKSALAQENDALASEARTLTDKIARSKWGQ
jgi:hypothetical protein